MGVAANVRPLAIGVPELGDAAADDDIGIEVQGAAVFFQQIPDPKSNIGFQRIVEMQRKIHIGRQLELLDSDIQSRIVFEGSAERLGGLAEILRSDNENVEPVFRVICGERGDAGGGMLKIVQVACEKNRNDGKGIGR